eukprot:Gb_39133 [translate_table: standard]
MIEEIESKRGHTTVETTQHGKHKRWAQRDGSGEEKTQGVYDKGFPATVKGFHENGEIGFTFFIKNGSYTAKSDDLTKNKIGGREDKASVVANLTKKKKRT